MRSLFKARHRSRAFTLIEVLIVIAMVGILAAIAIPNYTAYIQRAHRADAKAMLLQVAQWQQRVRTETNAFNAGLPASMSAVPATGAARYNIAAPTATATTFTLTATPTGVQTGDECGTFQLDHLGVRTVVIGGTTHGAGSAEVVKCWGR